MWQPIETAPKDWSDVLLHVPDLHSDVRTVCEAYFDLDDNSWKSPMFGYVDPTHWMPLPAPPEPELVGVVDIGRL